MTLMCMCLFFSMAVHPNKKIVATGQVASHDKDMGKVCIVK